MFERNELAIHDARNTKIKVPCAAALSGYYYKGTQLWHIPLVRESTADNIPTVSTKTSLQNILRDARPTPIAHIGSVYEIKAQLELVCYYHAATSFPTKLI